MKATAAGLYEDPTVRRATGEVIRPGGLALTDRAVRLCLLPAAAVVLDIGCGAGATVEHLRTRHRVAAFGIDPSASLLGSGRARQEQLPLLRGTAERLPLADASVDAVIAECVLSLLDEPLRGLSELTRVLRPGGRLVLSDLYARTPQAAPALRGLPDRSCLRGAMGRPQLLGLLEAAGLRVTTWEDHSPELARFAVRLLWESGSTQLWCPPSSRTNPTGAAAAIRRARPGYFLLLADKAGG